MNLFGDFNLADILSSYVNDSVSTLLNAITQFIYGLIGFFLTPLDNLITQYMPGISDLLTFANNFIDFIGDFIIWFLSWLNVPPTLLSVFLLYLIAKIMISFNAHIFKLVVAWWRSLAP